MMSYEKEVFARDRMRERLVEAQRERMARPRATGGTGPRPHHRTRFGLTIVRRLARLAAGMAEAW